jgi:hypothetical protein
MTTEKPSDMPPDMAKLKLMGKRPSASEMRRRLTSLQSTNDELIAFLSTLPPQTLSAAPTSIRTLLPLTNVVPRPHTVLPSLSRKHRSTHTSGSGSSPPMDSPADPSPAARRGLLPALEPTPQQRHPPAQPNALKPAPASLPAPASQLPGPSPNDTPLAVLPAAWLEPPAQRLQEKEHEQQQQEQQQLVVAETPGSAVCLRKQQQQQQRGRQQQQQPSPLVVRPSLEGLRKDLFSPRLFDDQLSSSSGALLSSTILSPVDEAKKNKPGPRRQRRKPSPALSVMVPPRDAAAAAAHDAAMMTPLSAARQRVREREEAGGEVDEAAEGVPTGSAAATPLRSGGGGARGLPRSHHHRPNSLQTPVSSASRRAPRVDGYGGGGGGLCTPASGRRGARPSPASSAAQRHGGGGGGGSAGSRQDCGGGGQLAAQKKSRAPAQQQQGRGTKQGTATRDCFMSRTGKLNARQRPGTLTDSSEQAAVLRAKCEARARRAEQRRLAMLEQTKAKASKNQQKLLRAVRKACHLPAGCLLLAEAPGRRPLCPSVVTDVDRGGACGRLRNAARRK